MGDPIWAVLGGVLVFIVPLAGIATLVYCFASWSAKLSAKDREFRVRMAELDGLERKQFIQGGLSEEERARLWDLSTIRNQAQANYQQTKDLMAFVAWSKYMNDDKK